MNYSEQSKEELVEQFTNLVKSKFSYPYLDGEARKSIDKLIFAIWQELKSRG